MDGGGHVFSKRHVAWWMADGLFSDMHPRWIWGLVFQVYIHGGWGNACLSWGELVFTYIHPRWIWEGGLFFLTYIHGGNLLERAARGEVVIEYNGRRHDPHAEHACVGLFELGNGVLASNHPLAHSGNHREALSNALEREVSLVCENKWYS